MLSDPYAVHSLNLAASASRVLHIGARLQCVQAQPHKSTAMSVARTSATRANHGTTRILTNHDNDVPTGADVGEPAEQTHSAKGELAKTSSGSSWKSAGNRVKTNIHFSRGFTTLRDMAGTTTSVYKLRSFCHDCSSKTDQAAACLHCKSSGVCPPSAVPQNTCNMVCNMPYFR